MKYLCGIPLLALFLAPVANADEQTYLDQLNDLGIPFSSAENALDAGYKNCGGFEHGFSYYEVVYWVGSGADLTTKTADNIVTTSITQLCPQYSKRIPTAGNTMLKPS